MALSNGEEEIIRAHPIGEKLDSFRAKFKLTFPDADGSDLRRLEEQVDSEAGMLRSVSRIFFPQADKLRRQTARPPASSRPAKPESRSRTGFSCRNQTSLRGYCQPLHFDQLKISNSGAGCAATTTRPQANHG